MSIRSPLLATPAAVVLLLTVACARAGNDADALSEKKTVASALPAATQSTPGVLDGRTFVAKLVEKGKESPADDQLVFADGTFRSLGCDEFGFTPAPYRTTVEGAATTFDAVATSAREGTMTWHGVVTGETLTGTALWEKPGQASIDYSYVATIRK
jgi:hypothetical protein